MWKYVLLLLSVRLFGWLPLRVLYGLANLAGELAYILSSGSGTMSGTTCAT
jgi:hypothetical protein